MNMLELKEFLHTIKSNNFHIDASFNKSELTSALLNHLGVSDPVLRDDLIYTCFSHMITNNFYTTEELSHILDTCLDNNHLFYGIGKTDHDSAFTRSFSSLIIAAVLNVNVQENFLTYNHVKRVSELLLKYLYMEQDVRGLVNEQGWAHSIAHVADALDELIKQPSLSISDYKNIFSAITSKMCFNQDYFHFEEDERMVIPIVEMLRRGLDEHIVNSRINEITTDLNRNLFVDDPQLFICRSNFKQFLRSLFFHLQFKNQNLELKREMEQALNQMSQLYYDV
ncbi:DUF2785 domain-containing protein [Tuberibacillus sp. Marseille-P3662]|uniref:DUF2785 domain-containing protein n=1 Tax=Tuberibacillus sp. Marseille-P3662 TaxID=1965358 RepID=UPI000A1CE181|nr:DUF2785 domain-containing protein [Tuberibacillus sp. Marseille-P3662]